MGSEKSRSNRLSNGRFAAANIAGQKFGNLTALRPTGKRDKWGKPTWLLQCNCEFNGYAELSISRLQKPSRLNCGHPCHGSSSIAGQKFGNLTALHLTGRHDSTGKPTWLLQCDCDFNGYAEMSRTRLHKPYRLNCGHPSHGVGLKYPAMPKPLPADVAVIVQRYLKWVKGHDNDKTIDCDIEDERMDRLLRAAWILVYRRSQGEDLSELFESRYINKSIRYAGRTVRRRRALATNGEVSYTSKRYKHYKIIGGVMTDLTSQNEAVSTQGKTQPEMICSKRRIKFKRC